MGDHPIEGLMETTMESIKDMVDVNTIVGDPVESPDGLVIIPISKVSFGFASGGGEYDTTRKSEDSEGKGKLPFGGGSGAGVSVQPVAFIVVGNGQMKLLPVDQGSNVVNNIIESIPKFTNGIQDMLKSKKEKRTISRKFKVEREDDEEEED